MKIVGIGGGMTGRMLNHLCPAAKVFEARSFLPEDQLMVNFGTNYLWKFLPGFSCKPIKVITHIDGRDATEASIKRYKTKVGKSYESAEDCLEQFEPESRGWEIVGYPENSIMYGYRAVEVDIKSRTVTFVVDGDPFRVEYDMLFSSIPLNILVSLCGLDYTYPVNTTFKSSPITVAIHGDYNFESSLIYVNYISDPTIPEYRVCQRNGKIHVESLRPLEGNTIKLFPGKIHDNPLTREIVRYLNAHDVFPVGRFGKWSSDELIHNTYEELQTLLKGLSDA